MMQLIIAEKPSVGFAIANALGIKEKHTGYLSGRNVMVSWCLGHLVQPSMPDCYDARYAHWRYQDLPILPKEWQFTTLESSKKQFDILKGLMTDPQVTDIICATDAGREGELIFRLVYQQVGCKVPVRRLWVSSLESAAILEAFHNMKSSTAYDNLYQAALCRSKADWLIGMNATRLYSLLYGTTLHVGRVMTPTLAMVTEREAKIQSFTPEPFYTVQLKIGNMTATSKRFTNRQEAAQACEQCRNSSVTVTRVETKQRSTRPPLLYDLTTLQRDANRLFGFTAQQTLEYAQSLYEKKLLTYPRTDSKYLTHDMTEGLAERVQHVAQALHFAAGLALPVHAESVIDDAKVSDHHAIIPTKSMPNQKDMLGQLSIGERDLLNLVCTAFLCAVGDPYLYEETAITVRCANLDFNARGKRAVQMGWQAAWYTFRGSSGSRLVDDEQSDNGIATNIKECMTFLPDEINVMEGKTTPPKRFTEDSMLHAMETAGKEDMPEDCERKGIGTPATRAAILEKLIETGLMERRGDKKRKELVPTAKGVALSSILPAQLLSPQLTAEWETRLLCIEQGLEQPKQFLADIEQMIAELVKSAKRVDNADTLFPSEQPSVGTCPKCGAPVRERNQAFQCENGVCGFMLWKQHGFLKDAGQALTAKQAATLLEKGSVFMKGLKSPKTKRMYDAAVCLSYREDGKPVLRPRFKDGKEGK